MPKQAGAHGFACFELSSAVPPPPSLFGIRSLALWRADACQCQTLPCW